jgi:hypothetical protein
MYNGRISRPVAIDSGVVHKILRIVAQRFGIQLYSVVAFACNKSCFITKPYKALHANDLPPCDICQFGHTLKFK